MKEKTCKTVRYSFGFIFAAFTVVVGALFIWQTLAIYYSGPARPFSRETVAAALSKIRLFFWLWVGGVVAGAVLFEVFPVKQKPKKICPDLQLARLQKRMPSAAPEGLAGEYAALIAKKKLVFALKCGAWALFGCALIYALVYICLPSSFTKHASEELANEQVLNFAIKVFPAVFAGLLVMCGAAVYEKYAVKSMLPLAQKVTRGEKPKKGDKWYNKVESFLNDWRVMLAIRIAIGVVAVALIIWGALNGNARAVFIKAKNICTQCIGLG